MSKLSDVTWYKEQLRSLEMNGSFDRQSDIDKYVSMFVACGLLPLLAVYYTSNTLRGAVWHAFSNMLQSSLNSFMEVHNLTRIRKQTKVHLPTGYSPNDIFSQPEMFGTSKFHTSIFLLSYSLTRQPKFADRVLVDYFKPNETLREHEPSDMTVPYDLSRITVGVPLTKDDICTVYKAARQQLLSCIV